MDALIKQLTIILDASNKLKDKYISNFKTSLDYLAIYTNSKDQYDSFSKEVSKLGKIVMEDDGVIVKLNKSIQINNEKINIIKICNPKDTEKIGYADYKVLDFKKFEDQIQKNSKFKKMKVPDDAEYVLYGLEDESEKVNLYFPNIPLSEDLEKSDKELSNEDELIVTIAQLEKELQEEKDKKLGLIADFHNYQNRVQQEKSSWGALSNMALIQDILEIYDDIELAMNDEELDINRAKESLKSAQDKIIGAALKAGVEKIDVKIGEDFDKERMEAVTTLPVKEESQKGKIIAVISSAYKLTNKEGILKPAKVIVGR